MNFFDIIILIITILSFIKGVFKGFISELATLAALILGIVGSMFFSGLVAKWLSDFVSTGLIPVVSFLVLFTGIVIAVHLLSKVVNKLLKAIALGWLNRIMGGIFASLKAIMLISIFIMVFDVFGFGTKIVTDKTREKSRLFIPVKNFAPSTFNLFRVNYEHLLPQKEKE